MKQGDLENLIMNVLWQHVENKTDSNLACLLDVQDIQELLHQSCPSRQWAYTTVKTVCDRVAQKGWVIRIKDGKRFLYQPTLNRQQAGLEALAKLYHQYYQDQFEELEAAVKTLKTAALTLNTDLSLTPKTRLAEENTLNTPRQAEPVLVGKTDLVSAFQQKRFASQLS